jgi:chemotaxis protein MotD
MLSEQASEALAEEQLSQTQAGRLDGITGKAGALNPAEQSVGDPAVGKAPAQTIGGPANKLRLHGFDTAEAGKQTDHSDDGIEMKSSSEEVNVTVSRKPTADGAKNGGDSNPDSFASSKRAAEARRGEQQSAAGRISVLSQQAAPAPAAPALTANAVAIVSALDADQGLRATAGSAVHSASAFKSAQPMRTLKIQLHPAELGVVTASLKSAGDQLTVELQVDNHEAYRRLSADSDAIATSLRSLGYDIDRISIQQPQAANASAASSDAGSLSRDPSSSQSGNSSSSGERFGGQANGRGDRGGAERGDQAHQGSSGGGLYI